MDFLTDFLHPQFSDFICLGIAALCIAISWYYHFFYFLKIKHTNYTTDKLPPVSIIIAAKNALPLLQNQIPKLISQQYPQFEIIIADDGSWDGTNEFIIPLSESETKIKYVFLNPNSMKITGKKIALTLGIKKAQFNTLVFTDADCIPDSNHWLSNLISAYKNETEIVIGYSPYIRKKSLLNTFIRFDNISTMQYCFGFAFRNQPYMGVGRNLSYTKNIYNSVNGFASHHHLPAGDDDLFVQECANKHNVSICLHKNSYMHTEPKTNYKAWLKQKTRHAFIGKYYKKNILRKLQLLPIVNLFFYLLIIFWFFYSDMFAYSLIMLVLKVIPEWIIFYKNSKVLVQKDLSSMYPIFHFMHTFWQLFFGIKIYFTKKILW